MTMIKDDDKDYFAHPYLSRTDIFNLNKSYDYFLKKRKDSSCSSASMSLGSALHCLILEPELFDKRYALWEGRRAGNDYKDFQLSNHGKYILSESENESIQMMRCAMPDKMKEQLEGCIIENSVYNDELKMKCRIDAYDKKNNIIYDIKTTRDIDDVDYSIYKYGYHLQVALYSMLIEKEFGSEPDFVFLFVDKGTGFWYERDCDLDTIEIANKLIARGCNIFKNKTNYTGRETIRAPQSYVRRVNELMESDICF